MKASIIIAVWNREDLIAACLQSALQQSLEDYEIIVVDDGSKDQTSALLAKFSDPRLTVLRNETNRGLSYTRNRAVRLAKGEYIIFLDSDCIVDPIWAQEIIKPFELDENIMIVSGKTIDPPSKTYWEMVNEGVNFIAPGDGYAKEAHGCNMALRGDFARKNFCDERLPFSEDLDLCLRCMKSGFRIYYISKASLVHFHRSSGFSSLRSNFRWGIYNAVVRLRWKQWPCLNYGTWLLLAAAVCALAGLMKMAAMTILAYLFLILLVQIRPGIRNLGRLIITYPGVLLIALANCLGNLLGLFFFISRKKFYEKPA